jgi:serine/threonine-protein kinase
MGRVWVARRLNSPTPQFVAVKTALDELAGDAEFERVFVDEARIASSIVHPNVCTIYEMGATRSIPYYVMEWVNGGSLHELLAASENHRIDYFAATRIVSNVCSGLHAAHELTDLDGTPMYVVHRDVSPQNILISERGHVKIADFGVARARGQLHKPTQTGELKGKLSYMAPEQLTSKQFDRRADVFALGCVLYQATTGQRPFHGNDALETMYKLLETTCEPPSILRPDYPDELERIVLKALSRNVETRYQTAEELERDLERFLTAQGKLVTDREIAELVIRTLGSNVSRRKEELLEAVDATTIPNHAVRSNTRLENADLESTGGATPSTQSNRTCDEGSPSWEPTNDSATTPKGAWESFSPENTTPQPKVRHRRELTLGVGALLLVIGGWLVWSRIPKAQTTVTSIPTKTATETPPPTASTPIEIRLRTSPAEATIRVDNGHPAQGVYVMSTMPSPVVHQVVVTLSGYETEQRRVVFDRAFDEVISLRAVTTPSPKSLVDVPVVTKRGVTSLSKVVSTTKGPTTPVSKPTDLSTVKSRKPKRSLDPTNPFAEP